MKHKIKILSVLIFHSIFSISQNLIPNFSFEIYNLCPDTGGETIYAIPWFQPNIQYGGINYSPGDYFHPCATNSSWSVPNNTWGSQSAKSGIAYVGIVSTWALQDVREYIEVELTDSLKAGSKYCARFYLSLADLCNVGINKMGMYFSKDSIIDTSGTGKVLPYIPQVYNADTNYFFNDKNNWMELSGIFTAEGGEKFLTIGNFDDDASTDTNYLGGGMYNFAYYYIDDVSVTLCDTVGVNEEEQSTNYEVQVFPNPANSNVTITTTGGDEIIISDITGRKIKEYEISNSRLRINTEEFYNGVYYLVLLKNNNIVATEKLVIIK